MQIIANGRPSIFSFDILKGYLRFITTMHFEEIYPGCMIYHCVFNSPTALMFKYNPDSSMKTQFSRNFSLSLFINPCNAKGCQCWYISKFTVKHSNASDHQTRCGLCVSVHYISLLFRIIPSFLSLLSLL
jgi:hypothetical protein